MEPPRNGGADAADNSALSLSLPAQPPEPPEPPEPGGDIPGQTTSGFTGVTASAVSGWGGAEASASGWGVPEERPPKETESPRLQIGGAGRHLARRSIGAAPGSPIAVATRSGEVVLGGAGRTIVSAGRDQTRAVHYQAWSTVQTPPDENTPQLSGMPSVLDDVESLDSSDFSFEGAQSMFHERMRRDPRFLDAVRREFERFDHDGDGHINRSELALLLDHLGMAKVGDDDVRLLMDEIDQDGNGALEFSEFVEFIQHLETQEDSGFGRVGSGGQGAIADRITSMLDRLRREAGGATYLNEKQFAARRRIWGMVKTAGTAFPQDGALRRWWDVVMLAVMTYIWMVCTTQIVMPLSPSSAVIIMDSVMSCGLVLDVAVMLNTAVQAEQRSFALVTTRRAIFGHYFRSGRLLIDVLSALPFDHIIWAATDSLDAWRLFRCVRLLKLLRYRDLFRMTDRGTRYMDAPFASFYFWTAPMLSATFKGLAIGHCVVLGRLLLSPQHNGCDDPATVGYGLDRCTNDILSQYAYAWFWVWALVTTQGMAALENSKVYAYAGFVMVLSLLVQGHVVASVSALYIKSNVAQHNMDSMRSTISIMSHYDIPESLQHEVLSFQYHTLQQNAAYGFANVLDHLPSPLQEEVGMYVKVELVSKVPMFAQLPQDCRIELAQALTQSFCEPQEYIIRYGDTGEEMMFLMHGFADVIIPGGDGGAERIVATVKRGDFFGEVALLGDVTQTRTANIQALTYCDLYRLGRRQFRQLCDHYAELRAEVDAEMHRRGLVSAKGSARGSTGTDAHTKARTDVGRSRRVSFRATDTVPVSSVRTPKSEGESQVGFSKFRPDMSVTIGAKTVASSHMPLPVEQSAASPQSPFASPNSVTALAPAAAPNGDADRPPTPPDALADSACRPRIGRLDSRRSSTGTVTGGGGPVGGVETKQDTLPQEVKRAARWAAQDRALLAAAAAQLTGGARGGANMPRAFPSKKRALPKSATMAQIGGLPPALGSALSAGAAPGGGAATPTRAAGAAGDSDAALHAWRQLPTPAAPHSPAPPAAADAARQHSDGPPLHTPVVPTAPAAPPPLRQVDDDGLGARCHTEPAPPALPAGSPATPATAQTSFQGITNVQSGEQQLGRVNSAPAPAGELPRIVQQLDALSAAVDGLSTGQALLLRLMHSHQQRGDRSRRRDRDLFLKKINEVLQQSATAVPMAPMLSRMPTAGGLLGAQVQAARAAATFHQPHAAVARDRAARGSLASIVDHFQRPDGHGRPFLSL